LHGPNGRHIDIPTKTHGGLIVFERIDAADSSIKATPDWSSMQRAGD
jgi:hypothetical protein